MALQSTCCTSFWWVLRTPHKTNQDIIELQFERKGTKRRNIYNIPDRSRIRFKNRLRIFVSLIQTTHACVLNEHAYFLFSITRMLVKSTRTAAHKS
jgi:hypothetical protein